MPITVLAIADEVDQVLYDHFCRERWLAVDMVLSCGDLPPEYLDFLLTSLNVPVFYVRGNHDGVYTSSRYDGCENVHGRILNYNGVRIAGFEGCRRYNRGPHQYTEPEMTRVVRRVDRLASKHGAPHIVLSHAPPAGIHDGEDLCHRGFQCFNGAIADWHPAFFVHGHTHSYYGQKKVEAIDNSTVVNAFPYRVFELAVPQVQPEPQRVRIWHVPWQRSSKQVAS